MSNDEKLTVLAQKELWYSPLFVNDVELENILFYNSIDGVIFQTNRGWFDCGNNSIGTITLFGECHNRRKINLSKNEIFLYKKELYIPTEYIKDFKSKEMTKEIGTKIYIFDNVSFVIDNKRIVIKTNYRFKSKLYLN